MASYTKEKAVVHTIVAAAMSLFLFFLMRGGA